MSQGDYDNRPTKDPLFGMVIFVFILFCLGALVLYAVVTR